ncbi:hypothetical protein [Synechococcus phage MA01]
MLKDMIFRLGWLLIAIPSLAYLTHTYGCVH